MDAIKERVLLQVVTGGHYDVDVVLTDPTRKVLYKEIKKQYDRYRSDVMSQLKFYNFYF